MLEPTAAASQRVGLFLAEGLHQLVAVVAQKPDKQWPDHDEGQQVDQHGNTTVLGVFVFHAWNQ